jgi:hypothetical protein
LHVLTYFAEQFFDARIGFELEEGYAITFGFATGGYNQELAKDSSSELTRVDTKGGGIESDLENRKFKKIGMNFVFRDSVASTNT